MSSVAKRWVLFAVMYLMVGTAVGMYMSIKQDFTLKGVHVYLNLLGWVSMVLIGLVYHLAHASSSLWIERVQFWMHQIGLPVMMVSLTCFLLGYQNTVQYIAIGSVLVFLSMLMFAVNLVTNKLK
jgi:cbb3-type cytochrome oxidase subunit 1